MAGADTELGDGAAPISLLVPGIGQDGIETAQILTEEGASPQTAAPPQLSDTGARPDLKAREGMTALDWAEKR